VSRPTYLIAAVALVSTLPLLAQVRSAGSAPPIATPEAEIVITARTEEALARFVEALTQTDADQQLARWNHHICPRVLGLDPSQETFIANRIRDVARRVKIPVAKGRCAANIVIIATADADRFTRLLVARYPGLFRDPRRGLAPRSDLAKLLVERPVRWIAASRSEKDPLYTASRLTVGAVENSELSMIIIDTNKLNHISWGQLSDYLSLVALSKPSMEAPYGKETVLSIFSERDIGRKGPPSMTDEDTRFLEAFYRSNDRVDADTQRTNIRVLMEKEPRSSIDHD